MDKSPTYPIGIGIAPTKKAMGHGTSAFFAPRLLAIGRRPSRHMAAVRHRATAQHGGGVLFEPKASPDLQGFAKVPAESPDWIGISMGISLG